jgi:hypothetical protein
MCIYIIYNVAAKQARFVFATIAQVVEFKLRIYKTNLRYHCHSPATLEIHGVGEKVEL